MPANFDLRPDRVWLQSQHLAKGLQRFSRTSLSHQSAAKTGVTFGPTRIFPHQFAKFFEGRFTIYRFGGQVYGTNYPVWPGVVGIKLYRQTGFLNGPATITFPIIIKRLVPMFTRGKCLRHDSPQMSEDKSAALLAIR